VRELFLVFRSGAQQIGVAVPRHLVHVEPHDLRRPATGGKSATILAGTADVTCNIGQPRQTGWHFMEARRPGRAQALRPQLETDAARISVRARTATSIDEHIGRRLRAAREERGMSLTDLAALAQIAPQQLQKYETARTRVSASRLYQLSAILGRPVFWFFEGP
jgi:hypothetical protein